MPGARVLELLNIYFDEVVPAVTSSGGEILKFMGDGMLVFFRHDAEPAAGCVAAFKAARLAHERLGATSVPDANLRAGIALHFGDASYGNIGSGERLDFTVIGRDVNLTSRIQGLCGSTSHPLLMSERFAGLLNTPDGDMARHALVGDDRRVLHHQGARQHDRLLERRADAGSALDTMGAQRDSQPSDGTLAGRDLVLLAGVAGIRQRPGRVNRPLAISVVSERAAIARR